MMKPMRTILMLENTESVLRKRALQNRDALVVSITSSGRCARGNIFVHVPKGDLTFILLLIAAQGRPISIKQFIPLLYDECPNGGPESAENVIHQRLSRCRQVAPALGFVIEKIDHGYVIRDVVADAQP